MKSAILASCAVSAVAGAGLRGEVEQTSLGSVMQTGIYKNFPIADLIHDGYKECYSALYRFVHVLSSVCF